MIKGSGRQIGLGVVVAVCVTTFAVAENRPQIETGYNSYGYPGMIDMPVATSRPDGELAFSVSSFAGQTRTTLTFQMLPRLSGSFRYSVLDNATGGGRGTRFMTAVSRCIIDSRMKPPCARLSRWG